MKHPRFPKAGSSVLRRAVPTMLAASLALLYSSPISAEILHEALTDSRSFAEDTLVDVDGAFAVSAKPDSDVVFDVAPDATLTIRSRTSAQWQAEHPKGPNSAPAAINLSHVMGNTASTLTFRGGSIVVERDQTESLYGNEYVMGLFRVRKPVRFENLSTTLQGNASRGIYAAFGGQIFFTGALAVHLDRSSLPDTGVSDLEAVNLIDKSFLEADGPVEIDLKAAQGDRFAHGITLARKSSALFHDKVDIVFRTERSLRKEEFGVRGIGSTGDFGNPSDAPVTFEGPVSIRHVDDSGDPIRFFQGVLVRDSQSVRFLSSLDMDVSSAKKVSGLYIAGISSLEVRSLRLAAPDAQEAYGVHLSVNNRGENPAFHAGEVELLLPNNRTESSGIRVEGGNARVTERLLVSADTALETVHNWYQESNIVIERGFETLGSSRILSDRGRIVVNESGHGIVRFTGETAAKDAGLLSLTIGSDRSETSYWTAFPKSTLTNLRLGANARLQFWVGEPDATDGSPAEGSVNGAVVTVTGETPVLLSGNADSGVAVLAGRNLKKGETVELLESRAGFVREEGGALLPADADLNDMKRGLLEVSCPSIASRTYLALSPDDYALHLQSENLLVADILADAEVVPQTRENARLESLSTSVLSTFGTLFTADDLLVDTILAADPAAKKEGPFAAARAGRWGIDADSRMTENVVSGLLGFAGRVADIRSGAFLEVGTGYIKTRTGTKDGVVNGSGTHNYAGAGVFVDHPVEAIGLTLTGYLKGGVVSSDFRAPLLSDDAFSSDFDRSALYWGAHLGAYGDVAAGRWTLRPYVAYHYDALEGRSVRIEGVGDVESADVHFGRADAHRVRAGTHVSYPTSRSGRFILGAVIEETFGSRVSGRASDGIADHGIGEEDLDGLTGTFTFGWSGVRDAGRLSYGFDLSGAAGVRNGVSGSLRILKRL